MDHFNNVDEITFRELNMKNALCLPINYTTILFNDETNLNYGVFNL